MYSLHPSSDSFREHTRPCSSWPPLPSLCSHPPCAPNTVTFNFRFLPYHAHYFFHSLLPGNLFLHSTLFSCGFTPAYPFSSIWDTASPRKPLILQAQFDVPAVGSANTWAAEVLSLDTQPRKCTFEQSVSSGKNLKSSSAISVTALFIIIFLAPTT